MEEPHSMVEDPESMQTSRVLKLHSDKEEFISHLTMGIEETLQAHPMIKDIKMVLRPPVSSSLLTAWERRHGVRLPSDLRGYYASTNGFRLTWSLVYGDEEWKVGDLRINTLQQLTPIETILETRKSEVAQGSYDGKSEAGFTISLADIQRTHRRKEKLGAPLLEPEMKAFHLDSSLSDGGSVCLVYKNDTTGTGEEIEGEGQETGQGGPHVSPKSRTTPEIQIWFLDRSFHWHFLAPTFNIFYRMAFFHLGLPDWMHRFTPYGLSSWTEQIFWLVAPKLLQPVKHFPNPNNSRNQGIWSETEIPPEAERPNPHPNVLNISMFKEKKKVRKTSN